MRQKFLPILLVVLVCAGSLFYVAHRFDAIRPVHAFTTPYRAPLHLGIANQVYPQPPNVGLFANRPTFCSATGQEYYATDTTTLYYSTVAGTNCTWTAVGGSAASPVSSVFTRTGAIVAANGDYTCAEVTNCESSQGAAPNMSGIYVSQNCGTQTNCFQVIGDGKIVTDATMTASSATVTTTTSDTPFACPGSSYPCSTPGVGSDVGKIEWGTYDCSDTTAAPCTVNCPQGTISSITNAHSVVLSIACTNSSVGGTDSVLVWGSDDEAQLVAATAALVSAVTTGGISSNLYLPCANILTSVTPFNLASGSVSLAYGISGCGGGGTMIIPTPKMNCTGGAGKGCLINDGLLHVETHGGYQPAGHFRDILFYGGGTNVKDAAATLTANTAGIQINYFTELENVWVVGWLWGSGTNVYGISNFGGTMIDSGSYAGGTTSCTSQGATNTDANFHGGSCGGSNAQGLLIGTGITSTFGVYFNLNRATSTVVSNAAGTWFSHGDSLDGAYTSATGGKAYLTGTSLNQAGGGASTLTVTGGVVHLQNVFFTATGGAINQSGGTIYDDCGNGPLPGTTPVITNLFGSCSVTGTTQIAGNIGFTTNWGTGTAASATAGDSHSEIFTITLAGTTTSPALATITFPTPFLAAPTNCIPTAVGGTDASLLTSLVVGTPSKTSVTLTYSGTLTAGNTIIQGLICQ